MSRKGEGYQKRDGDRKKRTAARKEREPRAKKSAPKGALLMHERRTA